MDKYGVATDVTVRFIGGRFCLETAHNRGQLRFDDASLLNILHCFDPPCSREEAITRICESVSVLDVKDDKNNGLATTASVRRQGEHVIDMLERVSAIRVTALIQEEDHEQAIATIHIRATLDRILAAAQSVLHDIAAMGPQHLTYLQEPGLEIMAVLEATFSGLDSLRCRLRDARQPHVQRQLANIDPSASGFRLNLGCGNTALPGWINIGLYPAPLAMDLRWGLPFGDESVAYVFMAHTLEHFYYPNEALGILTDIRRVL